MAGSIAPWLEGLSETWEPTPGLAGSNSVSSASHDASSLRRTSNSRIPKRSPSGISSTLGSQKTTSTGTTAIKRSPLLPLSNNNTNSLRRPNGSTRLAGGRSVSDTSEGSLLQCGTVQQRAKSASPAKKQETLEWKRRLVQGQLGYGDQTDLFGPSALENIFSHSKGAENDAPGPKGRTNWLQRLDANIPSSPPPWPTSITNTARSDVVGTQTLDTVGEEDVDIYYDEEQADGGSGSDASEWRSVDEADEDGQSVVMQRYPDEATEKHTATGAGSRTVSGQTELSQEDFSPVFISKHTSVNGQVNYAALDSHLVKQFNSTKVELRHPSLNMPQKETAHSDDDSEQGVDEYEQDDDDLEAGNGGHDQGERSNFTDDPQSDDMPAVPDLSLSENLPTGTPPVPNLGRHVELKRGGYSAYGSFKERPLSPSPTRATDSLMPDESELLSPVPAQKRPLPPAPTQSRMDLPTTPLRPTTPNPPKSRSSGSPLKLFAAHDTFTNNRLLRRMSQLDPEGNLIKDIEQSHGQNISTVANPKVREFSKAYSRDSFGSGELDNHTFNAEITITSASDSEKDGSMGSPGSEIPVPGSKDPLGFTYESSPEVKEGFKLKRKLSKQSAAKSSKTSTLEATRTSGHEVDTTAGEESQLDTFGDTYADYSTYPPEQVKVYDGSKRPPTSPFKNPTPKRRRTLHASELQAEVANANKAYHAQLQGATSSRISEHAPSHGGQDHASAETLASRKMLRPRNPTPSQRRQQQIEAELREAAEEFASQEPQKLEAVLEQIESSMAGSDGPATLQQQAEAVAAEVANFTLRVQKPSGEHGTRKRSVTTQDFLNEAMMVMQLIRSKQRPQSGLGSVEESDAEGLSMSNSLRSGVSVLEAGITMRVSRPPSREGGHSGWRSGMQSQADARVVSHLRRFQERDDTEFIADSVASLHVDEEDSLNDNVIVDDDQSNIRIIGPLPHLRREEEDADDSRPVSQRSADISTGRTNSTRKSDNVGTLAQDAVAHLIGQQVGGMTFDRETQCWIKVRSPERKGAGLLEPPSQLTSDDDPFREISDLPIEELHETRRSVSDAKDVEQSIQVEDFADHDQQSEAGTTYQQPSVESRASSNDSIVGRPTTRDSSHMQDRIRQAHSSSIPSRYTAFASSQQQEDVGTRATSYNDEELARLSAMGKARRQSLAYAAAQATLAMRGERKTVMEDPVEEVGEVTTIPSPPTHRKPAHLNGLAQHPSSPEPRAFDAERYEAEQDYTGLPEDTILPDQELEVPPIASPKQRRVASKLPPLPPSAHRTLPRHMSLRQKTLTNNRFTADAHEQSELSFVAALPGERVMSVSLSVSRPLTSRPQSHKITELQPCSPTKADLNATFLLSDLPDFTLHESDEEKPSERALATRLAQHAAAEVDNRYALAVKDIVKTLTDTQHGEPYWEDLKQLDLHDRSLASLYGLDEYCQRVQAIDVSDNALTHLEGTPLSVRTLIARSNQLSSLTCWTPLFNLQYLDVSGNHLDSLNGLASLVHLRELRADHNQITSLDGVLHMDGLLKLRLRHNEIDNAMFTGCQLQRLASLDLSDNVSCSVEGLEDLPALVSLRLDRNLLDGGLQIRARMSKLENLSLRACGLAYLDVSMLPRLRKLDIDDNALANVSGIAGLRDLDLLSMRRQALPNDARITVLDHQIQARRVWLSGNTIPTISLTHSLLNLQHLELAAVGLQELPADFGIRLPNLRTLNVNFNSLRDIRPLLNIQKLQYLSICGNRLDRLRKSVATLAKLSSLKSLDMRDNPVTLGFYPPALVAVQMGMVRKDDHFSPQDEDEPAEALEQAKHVLPAGDAEQDEQHLDRLDEATKLRRRVYELLLAHSCASLGSLDSLPFDKASANVKDRTWDRLVTLGVVKKSQSSPCELMGP